jgi:hypothetical protein
MNVEIANMFPEPFADPYFLDDSFSKMQGHILADFHRYFPKEAARLT